MAPIEIDLAQLHKSLVDLFSEEQLKTICEIHLGIDYDSLEGDGKRAKAREIVKEIRRNQRNGELVGLIATMRPGAVQMQTGRLGRILGIPPLEEQIDQAGEEAFKQAFIGQQSRETQWLRRIVYIMIGVQAVVLLVLLGVAVLG